MQRVRLGMAGKIMERVSKVFKDDAKGLECWEGWERLVRKNGKGKVGRKEDGKGWVGCEEKC